MMAGAIAGLFMVAVLPLCAHASAAGGVAGTAAWAERSGDQKGLDERPARGAVLRLRGGKTGGIKARDIWTKPLEELSQMEEDLRLELMSLRVAQQVGGQPGRVNQIKKVRKSIARVLTVATAKRRAEAFESVKNDKFKPLDARKNRNLPKAMRQRLNKYERTRMSNKAVRCLRLKIWGAGVRPMRRIVLSGPLEEVSTQPALEVTSRHALCLLLSIPSLQNHARQLCTSTALHTV
jgi:ribosomal protein L29